MNNLLLTLFLSNPYLATDKVAHFGVTSLGTATTLKLLGPDITWSDRLFTSMTWMMIGLYKEKTDPKFDYGDLRSDSLGVIYGNVLMVEF